MKKFLIGVILGICAPFAAGYLFVVCGGMPVGTKGKPLPLERFVAKTALHAAIGADADKPAPIPADEANLVAGAKVYASYCGGCHGRPDRPITFSAKGMFPAPPQLLPPQKGVTDDPVGETYWKVRNGIRLTGMPRYGDSLSDTELWQVSLFLLHADHLPVAAERALRPLPQ